MYRWYCNNCGTVAGFVAGGGGVGSGDVLRVSGEAMCWVMR